MQLGNKGLMTLPRSGDARGPWWFYVEGLENGVTVGMQKVGSPPSVSLEYSVDGGRTWTGFVDTVEFALGSAGSRAYFRASSSGNLRFASSDSSYHKFYFSGKYGDGPISPKAVRATEPGATSVAIGGEILSLFSQERTDSFPYEKLSTYQYHAARLFYGATYLHDVSELILPEDAPPYGFHHTFDSCWQLQNAPILPATWMNAYCYQGMFSGCSSLKTPPELPATEVNTGCYADMFRSCGLTSAPELPATEMYPNCYTTMFTGCVSLRTAPELPATSLANVCYAGMFGNCTNLTQAPALPATSLRTQCYSSMFSGCTKLEAISTRHTSWNTSYTSNWVKDVAASGTFTCPAALSQTRGADYIPEGWTIVTV